MASSSDMVIISGFCTIFLTFYLQFCDISLFLRNFFRTAQRKIRHSCQNPVQYLFSLQL
ncbi:hypothetical protein CLOM621_06154 [Clostridium sp. M62/1]|nr:hypothetical protein CLOM621_06154 [Clostridium sp. M62/1]